MTNRRPGSRAVYGKITVYGAGHSQFSVRALGRSESGDLLPPALEDVARGGRLLAGYLDRPLFVENFSAPEVLDPLSHRSLDDWNTFYQGGTRLVKYLRFVGYNGLMMSVLADGSAIYPSRLVEPTPRYDTGVFSSAGHDPDRKDVLELLLRLFDREGLTFVPGLDFSSPLAELEDVRRAGGRAGDGDRMGRRGRPHLAGRQPHAPGTGALLQRARSARAGGDVARGPRAGDALRQPRVVWRRRLAAFGRGLRATAGRRLGFRRPDHRPLRTGDRHPRSGTGAERFAQRAQFLAGEGHAAWIAWRAATLAEFHRRLRAEIVTAHPGARLYLAGGTMLESRQTQYRLRPTLPRRARLDEALAELGIRPQAYRGDSGIVLLRPQRLAPSSSPLAARAADLEINLAPEMDRLVANGRQTGSLFYHEPQKARLASFDVKSPFGAANTYTWLVSEMSPSGDKNRQRFVHSLATLDAEEMFDGGWMLALGQEEALGEVVSIYRQLPAQPFETVAGEIQPVTIRTLSLGRQTYVYLVNDSPWAADVNVALDLPAEARLEKIGQGRGMAAIIRTGVAASWKIHLRPYDLAAARFSAGRAGPQSAGRHRRAGARRPAAANRRPVGPRRRAGQAPADQRAGERGLRRRGRRRADRRLERRSRHGRRRGARRRAKP